MPRLLKPASTYIAVLWYIDLNMVRAGMVKHPLEWVHSGYYEIQQPPKRYAVIDVQGLVALCGFSKLADFQQAHRQWVEEALEGEWAVRDARWSEAIAVGTLAFIEKLKVSLESEQCIGRSRREMGSVYCANRVKLTGANLPLKVMR